MSLRFFRLVMIGAAALSLAACAGTYGTKSQGQQAPAATTSTAGAATQGANAQAQFQGNPLNNPHSILAKRTVYFAFDSSAIRPQDRPIIEAHAKYLASHPNARVTLQGNTDERGTEEYNLALGQRRADAVKRLMVLLGANPDQIKTVSFGKDHPVALGHNEKAWALNRRVDIVYTNEG